MDCGEGFQLDHWCCINLILITIAPIAFNTIRTLSSQWDLIFSVLSLSDILRTKKQYPGKSIWLLLVTFYSLVLDISFFFEVTAQMLFHVLVSSVFSIWRGKLNYWCVHCLIMVVLVIRSRSVILACVQTISNMEYTQQMDWQCNCMYGLTYVYDLSIGFCSLLSGSSAYLLLSDSFFLYVFRAVGNIVMFKFV